MARILVTEPLAESGLDAMRAAGHEVDVRLDLDPSALIEAMPGAHALIVRSATKVTADVVEAGRDLVVVGRAGTGLDNVDVAAATKRGVMVLNAPRANSISMAEHTIALLLAQARNIPQAHGALKAGKWERARWEGVELHGRTLGVLGVGSNTGSLVAQRGHAFGMRLIGWDPWFSEQRARQMGVDLVTLEELFEQADFVTVHLLKTPESTGLVGRELLGRAKPGLRIVNAARGGIIDEDALLEAIRDGLVAGAGLDVFAEEPCTSSPLFDLDAVVVTPHLGASTREAQDKAGVTIADLVIRALAGDFVPSVNISAVEVAEAIRPFVPLAELLGAFFTALNEGLPERLDLEYQGGLADHDPAILTLAVLKGLVGKATEEPVSYVNAPQIAEERGVVWRDTRASLAQDYVNLVTLRGPEHSVAATLFGPRGEHRLVMIDDHSVEIPPGRHMLVVRNEDRPGMIGRVGTILGEAGINIDDWRTGKSPEGQAALIVCSTTEPIPPNVLAALRAADGIVDVDAINLD